MSLPQSALGGNRFRPARFRAIRTIMSFARWVSVPTAQNGAYPRRVRRPGAHAVNRRREAYLGDWQKRMQWARGKR